MSWFDEGHIWDGCCCVILFDVSFLVERQQILDDQFLVASAQAEGRHEAAGFDRLRIADPGGEVFWGVRHDSRGQRFAAHQVREVGRVGAASGCAANAMAVDARLREERLLAVACRGIVYRRLRLMLEPAVEVGRASRR